MASDLKKKTAKGMFWSAVERFSTQGIQFLFGIVLARLLTPADYGVIAMLTIFLAICQTFIDSGFANAIIRKIDRTEKDMATMFFFNIGMSLVCYAILFFTAPFIASFYNMPELTLVLRVLALRLIVQSFSTVQVTNLTIKIDFKKQAKISLASAIISGIVGIGFAYNGYGVWSLVIQALFCSTFNAFLYWLTVRWHPQCFFDKESFKNLFSYGSKLLISGLLDTVYNNLYPLVIGKFYTPAQLGAFAKADHFSQFPSQNIMRILHRVSFPVLSALQNDPQRMRNSFLKFINYSALIIFPLMLGLLALSKPMTLLLLTERWKEMIPLLQILCIAMMWYPVHAINLNILQVLGRSDLFLKLEVIKKVIGLAILLITLPIGITAMCIGQIVDSILGLFINTYYSKKFINAGIGEQLKFLFPTLFNSTAMAAIILVINNFMPQDEYGLQIGVGLTVGILYYLTTNYLFNKDVFKEILSLLKKS
ncbi:MULTISPECIES: lipopolysaccharide biosynthesis protein [unclassified Fibrobacter]|jgi:O-antigen/teichoic acid export membrane protein|uniref:lipopolysaccharide biosynthesis protein n=1 Tax=unclassified Fibrobacter TaxID=2634177 RepID=UPI0009161AA0|nr:MULTISPECIES: lipopolysaccharide biosynthesis protein [unclassified Fibrobacter]SHM18494.1 Membrane protein involved in the export of O-antigen and teichoic acid [Fibrobacter sp. UWB7]SMG24822.1 Membrane protein involved in the export of O-antigen and teichoic acid [Fibrobacter sp. UWB13]